MSDLACWRQGSNLVIRYYGSEHLMTETDAAELADHIAAVVVHGRKESLGTEYAELRSRPKAYQPSLLVSVMAGLGVTQPKLRRT